MDWIDEIAEAYSRDHPQLDASALPPLIRLTRLASVVETLQHDILQPFELSPSDFGVLIVLCHGGRPHSMSPGGLARRIGLSSGGMTKVLKRLEESGLVERLADPEDGRGRQVRSTDRGRSLHERVLHAMATASSRLLKPFSRRQRREIDTTLGQLLDVLEDRVHEARDEVAR